MSVRPFLYPIFGLLGYGLLLFFPFSRVIIPSALLVVARESCLFVTKTNLSWSLVVTLLKVSVGYSVLWHLASLHAVPLALTQLVPFTAMLLLAYVKRPFGSDRGSGFARHLTLWPVLACVFLSSALLLLTDLRLAVMLPALIVFLLARFPYVNGAALQLTQDLTEIGAFLALYWAQAARSYPLQ